MNTKRQGLTALFVLLLFMAGGAAATEKTVTPGAPVAYTSTEISQLTLPIGKSTILRLPPGAVRMSVGNPLVMDFIQIPPKGEPRELYLLAKEVGSTNLIVWYKDGGTTVTDITVVFDSFSLESQLRQLMPGEKDIRVSTASDSIVLQGKVSDALKSHQAVRIADAYRRKYNRALMGDIKSASGQQGGSGGVSLSIKEGGDATDRAVAADATGSHIINMLTVSAPQQVMLEVKIAEINKTMAEKLGFDFARQFTGGGGAWTKTISGIIGGGAAAFNKNINSTQKIGPADLKLGGPLNPATNLPLQIPGATPQYPTLNLPAGASAEVELVNGMLQQTETNMATQDFTSWLIDAQKTDGLVKILAEPNIVAISGQEGSFRVGGEIMIPVPGSDGEVTLQSKEFGVGLSFIPTVLEEGRINIKVSPSVSELVGFNTVASSSLGAQVVVPTFTTRRVNTTVQLRDGQSLAIGGLLQDNFREQVKRFPFLGEIPILGTLFRSSEYQKNKTELLIVVTPRLIKPLAPDYILPTDGFVEPSRSELLFEGKMEGGKSQDGQTESAPAAAQPASGGFEME